MNPTRATIMGIMIVCLVVLLAGCGSSPSSIIGSTYYNVDNAGGTTTLVFDQANTMKMYVPTSQSYDPSCPYHISGDRVIIYLGEGKSDKTSWTFNISANGKFLIDDSGTTFTRQK